jgi:hypothetical protein
VDGVYDVKAAKATNFEIDRSIGNELLLQTVFGNLCLEESPTQLAKKSDHPW